MGTRVVSHHSNTDMFKLAISAICLLGSLCAAQIVRGTTVLNANPGVGSAGAAVTAAGAAVAPAAGAAVAPAAAPALAFNPVTQAPIATTTPYYPAQFFGPGVDNPNPHVPRINPFIRQRALSVIAENPNVRVFVGVDGQAHFTNEFGQEVEVTDRFGNDPLELDEHHENLLQLQAQVARANAALAAFQNAQTRAAAPAAAPAAPVAPSRFFVQQA